MTPGQAAFEEHQRRFDSGFADDWDGLADSERADWEATAQAAIAARQPQPATGERPRFNWPQFTAAVTALRQIAGAGTLEDAHELASEALEAVEDAGQPAPELAAAIQDIIDRYPEREPAPELAAGLMAAHKEGRTAWATVDALREQLAKILAWFAEEPVVSSRRYASVTRAQLASAYRDGGLSVPD